MNSGGTELLFSGGTASNTVVSAGGSLIVLSGGQQTGTSLQGGQIVSTGVAVYTPMPALRLARTSPTGSPSGWFPALA